ncbi:hypothetical protein C0Q44_22655 [Paenibacillus sp. PCH8]|uniref:S-layer homology domain-containing protein n=1 Tax=Paenibacillus sp. PCH8 TaxID=2066524 RepID=UPI000CF84B20|nr:S-layer homology domain-containing protein [Paenibacillus sp. PCH8]PQP81222.1 hypothetical protein C0Q44_22655 [Paenibacillus sp. PCH8]
MDGEFGGEKSVIKTATATTIPYPPPAWSGGSASGSTPDTSDRSDEANPRPEPIEPPTTSTKKSIKFIDISQTFNRDQITWLAEQNIIQGVSETRFEPRRPITRAEFTALIVRLMGIEPTWNDQHGFQDVNDEDWFAAEIKAAVNRDMVHGMGNGRFAPYALVTREQASKIIANVVRKIRPEPLNSGRSFTDQTDVSDWAKEEVQELAGMFMITGYQDGSFRPMQHLSRSEAAALIFRLQKLIQVMDEKESNRSSDERISARSSNLD